MLRGIFVRLGPVLGSSWTHFGASGRHLEAYWGAGDASEGPKTRKELMKKETRIDIHRVTRRKNNKTSTFIESPEKGGLVEASQMVLRSPPKGVS